MDPAQKDAAHKRRAGTCVGATVQFSGSMVFKGKKEDFLSNKENKQRFLSLLREHLEQRHECPTEQAQGDADVLIVQTVIAASEK